MKIWKKIAGFVSMVCVAAAIIIIHNTDVSAAEKASVESNNIEITTGSAYTSSICVKYGKGDAQIKNIKANSSSLYAKQTYQEYRSNENKYSSRPYGYANIGLYAKKSGSYKVSFDVCDASGKRTARFTVNVKAGDSVYINSPIKKVTFAGRQDQWYTLASKNSGKLKVTMNQGYKLKSITMEYDDAGGHHEKKIKNNAKVKLARYVDKSEDEYNYDYDWYSESYSHYYLYTPFFATTKFKIEYQNKKTKKSSFTYYSIYALPKN